MTGKYVKPELSEPQYLAQRYYLGHLCHSAALYSALGSSGHVRVRVSGDSARVDYVRAYLPAAEGGSQRNGDVSYSYVVRAKEITQRREGAEETDK